MISYEDFEKRCLRLLIKERSASDPKDLKKYIKEEESQEIIRKFYDEGVERYKENPKHDEEVAFGYCLSTAVENLNLLY